MPVPSCRDAWCVAGSVWATGRKDLTPIPLQFQAIPPAIADGLYNLLFADKTGINNMITTKKPEFQLYFSFWEEAG